jgi:hypothetical protein
MWIHVEIHDVNARLSFTMLSTAIPFAAAQLDVGHLGNAQAFPLTFRG